MGQTNNQNPFQHELKAMDGMPLKRETLDKEPIETIISIGMNIAKHTQNAKLGSKFKRGINTLKAASKPLLKCLENTATTKPETTEHYKNEFCNTVAIFCDGADKQLQPGTHEITNEAYREAEIRLQAFENLNNIFEGKCKKIKSNWLKEIENLQIVLSTFLNDEQTLLSSCLRLPSCKKNLKNAYWPKFKPVLTAVINSYSESTVPRKERKHITDIAKINYIKKVLKIAQSGTTTKRSDIDALLSEGKVLADSSKARIASQFSRIVHYWEKEWEKYFENSHNSEAAAAELKFVTGFKTKLAGKALSYKKYKNKITEQKTDISNSNNANQLPSIAETKQKLLKSLDKLDECPSCWVGNFVLSKSKKKQTLKEYLEETQNALASKNFVFKDYKKILDENFGIFANSSIIRLYNELSPDEKKLLNSFTHNLKKKLKISSAILADIGASVQGAYAAYGCIALGLAVISGTATIATSGIFALLIVTLLGSAIAIPFLVNKNSFKGGNSECVGRFPEIYEKVKSSCEKAMEEAKNHIAKKQDLNLAKATYVNWLKGLTLPPLPPRDNPAPTVSLEKIDDDPPPPATKGDETPSSPSLQNDATPAEVGDSEEIPSPPPMDPPPANPKRVSSQTGENQGASNPPKTGPQMRHSCSLRTVSLEKIDDDPPPPATKGDETPRSPSLQNDATPAEVGDSEEIPPPPPMDPPSANPKRVSSQTGENQGASKLQKTGSPVQHSCSLRAILDGAISNSKVFSPNGTESSDDKSSDDKSSDDKSSDDKSSDDEWNDNEGNSTGTGVATKPTGPIAPTANNRRPLPPIPNGKPNTPAPKIKPNTPAPKIKPNTPAPKIKPNTPAPKIKPNTPAPDSKLDTPLSKEELDELEQLVPGLTADNPADKSSDESADKSPVDLSDKPTFESISASLKTIYPQTYGNVLRKIFRVYKECQKKDKDKATAKRLGMRRTYVNRYFYAIIIAIEQLPHKDLPLNSSDFLRQCESDDMTESFGGVPGGAPTKANVTSLEELRRANGYDSDNDSD